MAQRAYVHNSLQTRRVYLTWEKDLTEEDKTWFEHRKMLESDYQAYMNLTSKVTLGSKKKGKENPAEMDMMLGTSRHFLVKTLITRWNVVDENGKNVDITENSIKKLPPEVVKEIVDDIYEFNPSLKADEEDDEGDTTLGIASEDDNPKVESEY